MSKPEPIFMTTSNVAYHFMTYGSRYGCLMPIEKRECPALSAFIQYETSIDINKLSEEEWRALCNDPDVQRYTFKLGNDVGEKLYNAISQVLVKGSSLSSDVNTLSKYF